jgi:hypothetical protein
MAARALFVKVEPPVSKGCRVDIHVPVHVKIVLAESPGPRTDGGVIGP